PDAALVNYSRKRQLTRSFVRRLVRCNRGCLQRRIDQLENNSCSNSGSEVRKQINPDVSPTRNAKDTNTQCDCWIKCAARDVTDCERASHYCHADSQPIE